MEDHTLRDEEKEIQQKSNYITRLNLKTIIQKDIKLLWSEKILEKDFIYFQVPANQKGDKYIKLQTYRYATPNPKGIFIYFHGYMDESSETDFLAKTISQVGLIYVAYDYRGHGNSEGKRTYFESIDQLILDAKSFILKIKEIYQDLPIFIGGLSMGGLISYHLSLESPNEFKGVVMFAPALKTNLNCCLSCLSAFTGLFCSCLSFKISPDGTEIFRNKEVRERVKKGKANVELHLGTSRALVKKMNDTVKSFKNYKANFIIFMGGNDRLVDPNCAFLLVNYSQSKDKHLYYYEEMFHGVIRDDETFDVFQKVSDFISARV